MRVMTDFNREHRKIKRGVNAIFGVVGLLFVAWIVALCVLAYKASSVIDGQDWSGGLKPVIERIWCGKPGCLG